MEKSNDIKHQIKSPRKLPYSRIISLFSIYQKSLRYASLVVSETLLVDYRANAKCEMRDAKCELRNAKCEMRFASYQINSISNIKNRVSNTSRHKIECFRHEALAISIGRDGFYLTRMPFAVNADSHS